MSKKLLIVDDDLYIRELYEQILKEAGFEVEMAEDGEIALKKVQTKKYHLILLDIMMPKLDGLGFLNKLIKEKTLSKNTPVVLILTNLAHESVIGEALKKGAAACFIKSDLTPDKLVEKIKFFLK